METGNIVQSESANALRTQGKPEHPLSRALLCPYPGHYGRIFQSVEQLFDQARSDLNQTLSPSDTSGNSSAHDSTRLSLEPPPTLPSFKKRPAESECHGRRRSTEPYASCAKKSIEDADAEYSRTSPRTTVSECTPKRPIDSRLFNPNEVSGGKEFSQRPQLHSTTPSREGRPAQRQSGLIELQRYDPRYPGLLLQPDSQPISQEQLASEVKSIYAGLTMVETKCIHVDRAQAAAAQAEPNAELASDHWQALIALHRTLLHEHHAFFLASQHPSASPALRRLASKYSVPARMWKHGIHLFLELLRRQLPNSTDYMLAFISLAYQMMELLYETVPAFEDTWIECLGELDRYRMAIEDEETRAGVARSWCSKAAVDNPTVGRLYHHLAMIARPHIQPWWQSISEEVTRTIRRLEHVFKGLHGVFRLVSLSLKSHKTVIPTCLCAVNFPRVSATTDSNPDSLIPDISRAPIFKSDTPFDITILALMAVYLLAVFLLRLSAETQYHSKAFRVSYILMIAMGGLCFVFNRDEVEEYVRTIVLAMWTTATLHTGVQYCYDNYNPTLHIMLFLVAAIIPVYASITSPFSPLDILPPYVALLCLAAHAYVALLNLAARMIHELRELAARRPPPYDEENNHSGTELEDRDPLQRQDTGVHTGQQTDALGQLSRRNSHSSRNTNATLPNPSVFEVNDDSSDASSALSDGTARSTRR